MSSVIGLIGASSGAYGPLLLGLLLLVGAVGVPFPGTALLLVAGALIREGVLAWPATISLALAGAVLGDSVGYFAGRYGGSLAARHAGRDHPPGRARAVLDRWDGTAVLLTRFLITPLAAPTNLVAASGGLSFRRFLVYAVPGEAIWVGLYAGLGYSFGGAWRAVSQAASDVSGLLVVAVVLLAAAYLVYARLNGSPQPAGGDVVPSGPVPRRKHEFFVGRSWWGAPDREARGTRTHRTSFLCARQASISGGGGPGAELQEESERRFVDGTAIRGGRWDRTKSTSHAGPGA